MFVPLISTAERRTLVRRKGGGAKGGGGAGKSGSGGTSKGSGSGSGSDGSSGGISKTSSISSSGASKSVTSYGAGGGKVITIPSGELFSGRSEGGGTRNEVLGTKTYGSGYPGNPGRGVAGRGFPFYFWPLAWGGIAGAGTAAYLHTDEYGSPNNSSRPGGIMMTAAFQSNSTSTIYRIVSDNTTVSSLITDINSNCSSSLASSSSTTPSPYNESAPDAPKPEQVIQYYRASSVALTLDGYNNTADLDAEGTPDIPLPTNIDNTLLDCLNQTIAAAVPLVDGAGARLASPDLNLIWVFWVLWCLYLLS